jgi:hypothetical protein
VAHYLVELYLSRMGAGGLEAAAARARGAAETLSSQGLAVRYVRSIFVPDDETLFIVFEASGPAAIEAVLERAGTGRARVLAAVTQP